MKTHGTNGTLGIISPFAFASAGEQSFNWAYEQLTKFRPGGKKYNRLRALLTAGEALKETPDLYAAAPELLACVEDILDADGDLNVMDFNRYRAAIAKAKPA